jgi:type IV pilus assembly protein PilW
MHLTIRFSRSKQAGFSLIELMVGMAIGLLATIVIIQVMSVFDAQRRSTTGSADAQTNGGIALYSIARELQMAGYPLLPVTDSPLECTTVNINAGATNITGITPVSVTDGVATGTVNASDRITIRYGSTPLGGAMTQTTAANVGLNLTVQSDFGCAVNDITLISSGGTCNLSKVDPTWVPAAPNTSIKVLDATGGGVANVNVACLGSWNEITYAVNPATGNLDRTARVNGTATTAPSVVGVVNLQVQYGISATASSNQVTAWVNPSGATWAAPTVADRNRIKAIRIAVVARNAKVEPDVVSTACSSTTAAAPTGVCAWVGTAASPAPTVDLSPADANWAKYRYRVYETIVPLRNVIWAKDTL